MLRQTLLFSVARFLCWRACRIHDLGFDVATRRLLGGGSVCSTSHFRRSPALLPSDGCRPGTDSWPATKRSPNASSAYAVFPNSNPQMGHDGAFGEITDEHFPQRKMVTFSFGNDAFSRPEAISSEKRSSIAANTKKPPTAPLMMIISPAWPQFSGSSPTVSKHTTTDGIQSPIMLNANATTAIQPRPAALRLIARPAQ